MRHQKFKVCVRCFTFNQAKYITDAMDGFCNQQTDFPFVCCIVDDASTDGEQTVISNYLNEHFDVSNKDVAYNKETEYAWITFAQHTENKNCYFAVLFLKHNHYSIKKPKIPYLVEWRDNCEYEALCEGDDYWTCSTKLAHQVQILDSNSTYTLVHSKARIYYQEQNKFAGTVGKGFIKPIDLFLNNNICTLSTCYRVKLFDKYEEEIGPFALIRNWRLGDFPCWLWMQQYGNCIFWDEEVAVYRVLSESASHTKNIKNLIKFQYDIIDICSYFSERYGYSKYVKYAITGKYVLSIYRISIINKSLTSLINNLTINNLFRTLLYALYKFKSN